MSVLFTIVSLRWALTLAVLRRSAWQTVGYVIGVLAALGGVATVAVGLVAAGQLPSIFPKSAGSWSQGTEIVRVSLILAGALVGIAWMVIPLSITGEGSSVSARRFALYGISDVKLTGGVLLAGLLGIPAISAFICILFSAISYHQLGVGAVVGAVISAFLAVIVFVSISKALLAAMSLLVRSQRGQFLLYVVIVSLVFILFQIPSGLSMMLDETVDTTMDVTLVFTPLSTLASGLAWTPWGAAFALPTDIYAGNWGAFAARVIICIAAIGLAYAVSVWCLRVERLRGHDSKVTVSHGLGWLGKTPDSISGAISGRIAQYWLRDPRYAIGLIMPVIMGILLLFSNKAAPGMVWATPITIGLIYPMIESNNLAYDGTAFTQQVLAGVRGKDDRRGRLQVSLSVSLLYILVSIATAIMVTGSWNEEDVQILLAASGGSIGLTLTGLGLAQVLSTVLIYPVPSIDKPFSSPQGRAAAQGFFPFVQMLGSFVLMVPTFIVLGKLIIDESFNLMWSVGLCALLNGAIVLVLGVHLGGKLLDRRTPKILQTLENYASLQK